MSEKEIDWEYVAQRYESLYNCNHKEHINLIVKYQERGKEIEALKKENDLLSKQYGDMNRHFITT